MASKFSKENRVQYKTKDDGTLVVEVERDGSLYIMHMVNEDNRFRPNTITAYIEALDDIEADFLAERKLAKKNDRTFNGGALITVGNGHIYSNGLDFALLMSGNISTLDFFNNYYHKVCLRVLNMPMPTVAAINGHAFAGGMMFALCHDYKIMRSDRGYLCMPEVDLPGALSPGMMSLVARSVNTNHDLRNVILQGQKIKGQQAVEMGLVDSVVPSAEKLLPAAKELGLKWAPKSSKSPIIYKQLRLEMRSETVQALTSGGIGYIPKL